MIDLECLKVHKGFDTYPAQAKYATQDWKHVLEQLSEADVLYSVTFEPHISLIGFSFHGKYMFSSAHRYVKNGHIKLLRFLYDMVREDLRDGVKHYIMGSESVRSQYRDGYMLQVVGGMKDRMDIVEQADKDFISTIVLSGK